VFSNDYRFRLGYSFDFIQEYEAGKVMNTSEDEWFAGTQITSLRAFDSFSPRFTFDSEYVGSKYGKFKSQMNFQFTQNSEFEINGGFTGLPENSNKIDHSLFHFAGHNGYYTPAFWKMHLMLGHRYDGLIFKASHSIDSLHQDMYVNDQKFIWGVETTTDPGFFFSLINSGMWSIDVEIGWILEDYPFSVILDAHRGAHRDRVGACFDEYDKKMVCWDEIENYYVGLNFGWHI
jgi:hypothetical protein